MSNYSKINEGVLKKVLEKNEVVFQNAITSLVEEQLEGRKELVIQAVQLIRDLNSKKDKIKPNQTFDRSGQLISESYSTDQISKLNLIQQHIKNVDAALIVAFEKADYDTLKLCLSDGLKI